MDLTSVPPLRGHGCRACRMPSGGWRCPAPHATCTAEAHCRISPFARPLRLGIVPIARPVETICTRHDLVAMRVFPIEQVQHGFATDPLNLQAFVYRVAGRPPNRSRAHPAACAAASAEKSRARRATGFTASRARQKGRGFHVDGWAGHRRAASLAARGLQAAPAERAQCRGHPRARAAVPAPSSGPRRAPYCGHRHRDRRPRRIRSRPARWRSSCCGASRFSPASRPRYPWRPRHPIFRWTPCRRH